MTSKAKKNCEGGRFWHRWLAWKVVRSIAAVRQRPRTPRNWQCSFAFFESFLWHFNEKQRAEVIFRLSRPVSCKNQEKGAGKQWSLRAPLHAAQLPPPPTQTKVWSTMGMTNAFKAGSPPLIWVFGHFYLHHDKEEVERRLLWELHKKFKGKLGQMYHRSCSLVWGFYTNLYTKLAVSENSIALARLNLTFYRLEYLHETWHPSLFIMLMATNRASNFLIFAQGLSYGLSK